VICLTLSTIGVNIFNIFLPGFFKTQIMALDDAFAIIFAGNLIPKSFLSCEKSASLV
jgi:hypothetical protein